MDGAVVEQKPLKSAMKKAGAGGTGAGGLVADSESCRRSVRINSIATRTSSMSKSSLVDRLLSGSLSSRPSIQQDVISSVSFDRHVLRMLCTLCALLCVLRVQCALCAPCVLGAWGLGLGKRCERVGVVGGVGMHSWG